jgi:23S rRNA pseudouridine2457 synthase
MKYFAIYKPYGVLSQFTDRVGRKTLRDLYDFPAGVYPIGRLDFDSEGLLLLSDNKILTDFLLNPKYFHEREYYVLVEGVPTFEDLKKFASPIEIEGYFTRKAHASLLENFVPPKRIPPVRFRQNIIDTWISLILTEGKNRQVRKMTAKIGFPTLRLIRYRIKNITLGNLSPGEVRELTPGEIKKLSS